ncbi:uncharacterized protein PADG_11356 [Paracoccidioides brasiliensis Pb18]|uniref:Uncharacterized protein n=1 Tax=Paracoccidioides brasiliensis (strain Pb18) TaxID=502780 RepID=A0A0A0HVV5_PARBD|nr:uncharacterized protein PADG_11356 [Paracoccidioides brasiliensis Pb18]KGM92528.1 hypothetical protein PADG_11356 [Paracoccidioides brasiliensis Pb18]
MHASSLVKAAETQMRADQECDMQYFHNHRTTKFTLIEFYEVF